MSTRVTGGARRERHVTKSEEKERLLAVHAIAKNFVQYKHRLECSVSWCVLHMKYCKYEHRTYYCIPKRVRVRVSCWISFFACNYFTSYRKSTIKPLGGLIYFQQQQQQQQQHLSRAPNGCFLWNICLEKQKLPRIFYSLTVPFVYNFRSLSNKFPTIFWSLIFPISLTRLSYFS